MAKASRFSHGGKQSGKCCLNFRTTFAAIPKLLSINVCACDDVVSKSCRKVVIAATFTYSLKVDLHDLEQAHQSKSASNVCVTDARLTLKDLVSHRTCVATTSKTNKHLQAAKQVCHVWAGQ